MKVKIRTRAIKEVDIETLHVEAGVRYWEDAEVNGVSDDEGNYIPCREGDMWCPVIDVNTGQILNWDKGKFANVHYKVCDSGSYYLNDKNGDLVLSREDDYVPKMLCPKEKCYGDYIIMDIDENGFIKDWKFDLSDFLTDDEDDSISSND